MRTIIRALCLLILLVLLALDAGKTSAQIGAVIDALPADRDYVEGIIGSIPRYEDMTTLEKVRALRRYVYSHTPMAWAEKFLIHDQVVNLPLKKAYTIFEKEKVGGVWCGGTAIMLSRVYKAAGFNSWVYNFGAIDGPSHVTTLVEVDGGIILQDAYFNIEYVDAGMPVPFLELISIIRKRAAPNPQTESSSRVVLFQDLAEAKKVLGPETNKCQSEIAGVRCSAAISLSHYLDLDEERDLYEFLESRGWPRQFEYLMLYPISVVSMYSDTVGQAQSLLDGIKQTIREVPLDVSNKVR
jgi:hypothetical protein